MMNLKYNTNLVLGLLLCFLSIKVSAQSVGQIGFGNSISANTLYSPVYRFSATSTTTTARSVILFTADEMSAAGITNGTYINAIQFNKTNVANFATPATFSVYAANTSNTSLATTLTWASVTSNHTQVYSSTTFNMPSAAGWVTITFSTPFQYTGSSFQIATDLIMGASGAATDKFQWEYTDTIPTTKIVGVTGTSASATLSGSVSGYKFRPNIKINYTPASLCTAPPTAGVAESNTLFTCPNSSIALTLSGNSSGSGQTYQWESSSSLNGTYTPVGTTENYPNRNITITANTYYRCAVTCSGQTTYSTPVLVNVSPRMGTYTVNPTLPKSTTNFHTITDAVIIASCGAIGPIIIDVDSAAGPYNEQVTIPQISGASSTNTITINGHNAIIQFSPLTANRHIFKLDGADYVHIKNFNIKALTGATYCWGVHFTNDANFDSVTNCTIDISAVTSTTQSNSAGIVASNSTSSVTTAGNNANNCVIKNNTIIGAYQGVIFNGLASGVRNVRNTISNNTIYDFYANGIEVTNQDQTFIEYNNISRSGRVAVTTFTGIEIGANCKRLSVNGNRIHDTHNAATTQSGTSYGIYANACDAHPDSTNKVVNNIIYNFNALTGTQYGLYNAGSNGLKYYHNTVTLTDSLSTAGITRGFYQTTEATDIEFKNNIIYIKRSGTGAKHCLHFNTATSTIVSDNNVLEINAPAGINSIGYYGGDFSSLQLWKTANNSIYDQSSTNVSPGFINVKTGDLRPTNGLINNIGTPVGVLTDMFVVTRSVTNPDPGAVEFNVGPCSVPPTAGDATVYPTFPVCAGGTVELGLSGNTFGTSQTYQWEVSASFSGPFVAVSSANIIPGFVTTVNTTSYFRCAVTCNSNVSYSTPILVKVSSPLAAGIYTINSALSSGFGNFQSFDEAVNAINCGVQGTVTFKIAPGTYTSQAVIKANIPLASEVIFESDLLDSSTVKIEYPSSASTSANYVLSIERSRNITFKHLTFIRTGSAANSIVINLDSTTNIKFYNTHFFGPTFTASNTTGSQASIFSDDTYTEDSTYLVNCKFSGNTNGTWLFNAINTPSSYIRIEGCVFNSSYTSIFLKHHNNPFIKSNIINRNATGAFDAYGMSLENCKLKGRVLNNIINADRGYGIRLLGSGGSVAGRFYIHNNMVSVVNAATSNAYGLSIESNSSYNASYVNISHNTVMVSNTSATTSRVVNMAGVTSSSNENVELVNNILVNNGSGYVYYVPANAATATVKFNFNAIYAVGNNIGTWGGTTAIANNMQAWISSSNQDSLSTRYLPTFVSQTNLRLTGSSIGNFALACVPNTLVTTDIDGTTKGATHAYKGAHEGAIALTTNSGDAGVWSIISPLTISSNGNENLIVKLRNNGVVPISSVEIKYSVNGTWNPPTLLSAAIQPGRDTVISLGVVAMPTGLNTLKVWTENVNSSSDDLDKTNDTSSLQINSFPPLNGNYTVGVGGDFTNLTGVTNALQTRTISGSVIFELLSTYTSANETFPITFTYQNGTLPFPITIRPAVGVTLVETHGDAGSANSLIVLDGISGLTFDGRAGGVGSSLNWIIRNRRTATTYGSAIRLINGSQRNTFTYLTLESQSTTSTTGLFHLSTSSTAGKGNSFNTLSYSLLQDRTDTIRTATYTGVYSSGTAANPNDSNVIINNTIKNFTNYGVYVTATGNGNNWTISGNQFFYNSIQTPTATAAQTAISLISEAGGNTISNNVIGGTATNASGAAWTNSGSNLFAGIIIACDTINPSLVSGNTIKNIAKTATGAASFTGIRATQGRVRIANNSIGDLSVPNSITNSGTSTTNGIEITNATGTADTAFIQNNTVANITTTGTGTGARLRGISINFSSSASVLHHITGNIVANLSCAAATTALGVDVIALAGIASFNEGYRTGCIIANNTISNITSTTTGTTLTVVAGLAASNYAGNIYNNVIKNVKSLATTPAPQRALSVGMYNRFLSDAKVYNNMIATGEGNSDQAQVNGILICGTGGGTHNYYHNTVVINPASNNSASSFAFHRGENNVNTASAHPINLRNNIFINRTTALGKHYAIGIEDTAVVVTGLSNYNLYYSTVATDMGLWGSSSYGLASWRAATQNDAQTKFKDAQFIDALNGDLHLAGSSIGDFDLAGTPISVVAVDFDQQPRHAFAPYMGADENISSPLPVTLTSFTGRVNNNLHAALTWVTATELNSDHFEIQYSVDGTKFVTINKVKAAGNSQMERNYFYQHYQAFAIAPVLYYRLKQVDVNGDYTYSNVITLGANKTNNDKLEVYPNPFNTQFTIQLPALGNTTAQISISNLQGIELIKQDIQFENGQAIISNLDGLSSGIYLITVHSYEIKQTLKLIKQ